MKSSKKHIFFILTIMLNLVIFESQAQVSFIRSITKQDLIQSGKLSYNNRCSGCHGLKGDGNTSVAKMLNPRPRNFTSGIFKFKSVPIGKMPTNDDLMRILNQGIPGTSMPEFKLVSDQEKRSIIEYIKTFAPEAWKSQTQDDVVAELVMPKGVFTKKSEFMKYAEVGRVWYQELGCVACHGNAGQGDGASAATLKDTWGNPIRPANLSSRTIKRGARIQDIAKSIMLGVDGTPMPAHFDVLQSLEAQFPELKEKKFIWELAAYVFYLRGEAAEYYKSELKPIPAGGIPRDEVNALIGQYLQ